MAPERFWLILCSRVMPAEVAVVAFPGHCVVDYRPLTGCLTQRNVKRHAHGRNSAEIRRFFRFSSPKSASRFQGEILGRPSGGLPVCLGGSGRHVPKTLELGTTGHQFNSPRKVRESVFANRIRKPVFRLNCVIGFSEHIVWPEAQGFMLNRPEAPVSFYVPLRKTTP